MKVNFKTIKKLMLNEQYNSTDLEIAALGGDITGISEMLKTKGIDGDKAGTFMALIRSGLSESEALGQIKG